MYQNHAFVIAFKKENTEAVHSQLMTILGDDTLRKVKELQANLIPELTHLFAFNVPFPVQVKVTVSEQLYEEIKFGDNDYSEIISLTEENTLVLKNFRLELNAGTQLNALSFTPPAHRFSRIFRSYPEIKKYLTATFENLSEFIWLQLNEKKVSLLYPRKTELKLTYIIDNEFYEDESCDQNPDVLIENIILEYKKLLASDEVLNVLEQDCPEELSDILVSKSAFLAESFLNPNFLLRKAIIANSKKIVTMLHAQGADINYEFYDKWRPASFALLKGHFGIFSELVSLGAIINFNEEQFVEIFWKSIDHNHIKVLEFIAEHPLFDYKFMPLSRHIALHSASERGCPEVAEFLIEKGVSPNLFDSISRTPFSLALKKYIDLHKLFSRNADENFLDSNSAGQIPKILDNQGKVLNVLIKHGADVNLGPKDQDPALILSTESGLESLSEQLIHLKAEVNVHSLKSHKTPAIMFAAQNNMLKTVEMMYKYGADLNAVDALGNTALLVSAGNGNMELTSYLIQKGANLRHVNQKGQNAYALAESKGHQKILSYLNEQK